MHWAPRVCVLSWIRGPGGQEAPCRQSWVLGWSRPPRAPPIGAVWCLVPAGGPERGCSRCRLGGAPSRHPDTLAAGELTGPRPPQLPQHPRRVPHPTSRPLCQDPGGRGGQAWGHQALSRSGGWGGHGGDQGVRSARGGLNQGVLPVQTPAALNCVIYFWWPRGHGWGGRAGGSHPLLPHQGGPCPGGETWAPGWLPAPSVGGSHVKPSCFVPIPHLPRTGLWRRGVGGGGLPTPTPVPAPGSLPRVGPGFPPQGTGQSSRLHRMVVWEPTELPTCTSPLGLTPCLRGGP